MLFSTAAGMIASSADKDMARGFDRGKAPKRVFIAIGAEEKPFMKERGLWQALRTPR